MTNNDIYMLLASYETRSKNAKRQAWMALCEENKRREGDWTSYFEYVQETCLREHASKLSSLLCMSTQEHNVFEAYNKVAPFGMTWSDAEWELREAYASLCAKAWGHASATQCTNNTRSHMVGLVSEECAYEYAKAKPSTMSASWNGLREKEAMLKARTMKERRTVSSKFAKVADVSSIEMLGDGTVRRNNIEVKGSRNSNGAVQTHHAESYKKNGVTHMTWVQVDAREKNAYIYLEAGIDEVLSWGTTSLNGKLNYMPESVKVVEPTEYQANKSTTF